MNDYSSTNPQPSLLIWGLIKGQPALTVDTLAWRRQYPKIASLNLFFTSLLFPFPSFLHPLSRFLLLPACAPRQHKETIRVKTKTSKPFFRNLANISGKPIGSSWIIYHRCILEWKSPLNVGIRPDLEFESGLRIWNPNPNQICLVGGMRAECCLHSYWPSVKRRGI